MTAATPSRASAIPIGVPRAQPVHDTALDGMRFVALLFVTAIHIGAKGFGQLGQHWWAINAYESVSRVAVPLFFMISGALLLPRQQTIGAIGKRLWRIAVPLLGWSVLYLCWFRYAGDMRGDWVKRIVLGPVVAHLWYLYALAGAYLFLPVMAGFYQATAVRVQVFCLAFWFLGACVIPLEIALRGAVSISIDLSYLSLYGGYMVAGAVLYHHLPARLPRPGLVWAAWILLSAAIALATWWRCDRLGRADEAFYVYSSPLVALAAFAAFCSLRWLFATILVAGSQLERFLAFFGKTSFGVYLMHVWALFFVDAKFGYDYQFVNPWIAIPVLTLFIVLACSLAVRGLQQIPGVRMLVPS
ncbi:acyltransferase [Pseudoduganella chitinolytica]|uniref:Acyltransferase family protein n=1 Tax=Pseudoduganella chitinolytica TaxID=34070 RepID=A0ABY8BAI5_9BURK|nr:acyltransferase family protein [Pseudoduganella chitinolytica]WEF32925.1 acyltransferase family protein [Pseudoduganella chitinolytica]